MLRDWQPSDQIDYQSQTHNVEDLSEQGRDTDKAEVDEIPLNFARESLHGGSQMGV